MDYIAGKHPDLVPLYDEIYNKHDRSYFEALEVKAEEMAKKYDCPFVDNEMPYGRVPQGHPVIVDYFYHEEIRGTENVEKEIANFQFVELYSNSKDTLAVFIYPSPFSTDSTSFRCTDSPRSQGRRSSFCP